MWKIDELRKQGSINKLCHSQFPVLKFSEATISMFLPIFLQPVVSHLKLYVCSADPFSLMYYFYYIKNLCKVQDAEQWRSF